MQPFRKIDAVVAPLDRANIDTDAILPKQFMKSIKRTGFGANLFDEWRYLDHGEPGQDLSERHLNPDFPLNRDPCQHAQVLLARENFGCGSSREHAVWALCDFGIRAVIAPGFADIFHTNCFKNGLLPITFDSDTVSRLFLLVDQNPDVQFAIDLEAQTVTPGSGAPLEFDIDPERKRRLLAGLDDIELTLQHVDRIHDYELRRSQLEPWLFNRAASER